MQSSPKELDNVERLPAVVHYQPTGGQRLPRTLVKGLSEALRQTHRGTGRCSSSHQRKMKKAQSLTAEGGSADKSLD